jgi:hypothetical protein
MESTIFVHRTTGRTFTAEAGAGTFGAASRDGRWDTGQAGVIWPAEHRGGSPVWTALG